MKAPRDLIRDLLPLYLAGELSPVSKAFVEEALAEDPELATAVRSGSYDLAGGMAPNLPPELELRSLRRTRRLLNLQKWLFGLSIAFTAIALAIEISFDEGRVASIHFAIQDHPLPLSISALLAALFWTGYFVLRRRLRSSAS